MTNLTHGTPSARKITTLADLIPGQIAAIRIIPAEQDAIVEPFVGTWPNHMFASRERFEREEERIFHRFSVPVTLSALLEPGGVVAMDGYGIPLLIARQRNGAVRVFKNACQHKGAKISEDCVVHKQGRITCPCHALTYGIDGKLIGVSRADVFQEFDKFSRNLVELESREWDGFVYAQLNGEISADWSHLNPEVGDDLDALGIGSDHERRFIAGWRPISCATIKRSKHCSDEKMDAMGGA